MLYQRCFASSAVFVTESSYSRFEFWQLSPKLTLAGNIFLVTCSFYRADKKRLLLLSLMVISGVSSFASPPQFPSRLELEEADEQEGWGATKCREQRRRAGCTCCHGDRVCVPFAVTQNLVTGSDIGARGDQTTRCLKWTPGNDREKYNR